MFQFPRCPRRGYRFTTPRHGITRDRLPHSGTLGSSRASRSPRRCAAWPRPSSARQTKASTTRPSILFAPQSRVARPRSRRARVDSLPSLDGIIIGLRDARSPRHAAFGITTGFHRPSQDARLSRCARTLKGEVWEGLRGRDGGWGVGMGSGPRSCRAQDDARVFARVRVTGSQPGVWGTARGVVGGHRGPWVDLG